MFHFKVWLINNANMAYSRAVSIQVLITIWTPGNKILKKHRLFNLPDRYVYVHRGSTGSAYEFYLIKALFLRAEWLHKCQVLGRVRVILSENKSMLTKGDYSRVLYIFKDLAPCPLPESDVLIIFIFVFLQIIASTQIY